MKLSSLLFAAQRYVIVLGPAFFSIIIARYLEKDVYGLFITAEALVAIFCVFSLQALDSPLHRGFLTGESDTFFLSAVFLLKLLSASLGYFLLVLTVLNFYPSTFMLPSLLLGLAIFFRASFVYEVYIIATGAHSKYALIAIVIVLMGNIVRYLALLLDKSLSFIAFLYLIDILSVSTYLIIQSPAIRVSMRHFREAKSFLIKAMPLVISSSLVILYSKIDQLMLEAMWDLETAAEYSILVRTISLGVLGLNAFFMVESARSFSTANASPGGGKYRQSLAGVAALSFVMAVSFFVLSQYLFEFAFNGKYLYNYFILVLASVLLMVATLGAAIGRVFILEDLFHIVMYRNAAAFISNILMNFLLIPKYGMHGAIIASIVSWTICLLISPLFSIRGRGIYRDIFLN